MSDKIDELYDALKADGIVEKDRENFRNYMLAPGETGYKNRLNLYNALKADGIVSSPTYEEFRRRLGIEAKQQSGSNVAKSGSTAQAQQSAAQPTAEQPAQAQQLEEDVAKQGKPLTPTAGEIAAFNARTDAIVNGFKEHTESMFGQLKRTNEYALSAESVRGKPKKGELKFNGLSGKVEQTYITPYGNETSSEMLAQNEVDEFKREQQAVSLPGRIKTANARVAELEEKLRRRSEELVKEMQERDKSKPWYLNMIEDAGKGSVSHIVPENIEDDSIFMNDAQYNALKLSLDQAKKGRQQLLNAQDRSVKDSFWRGFGRSLIQTNEGEWDFGRSDLRHATTMLNINRRQQSGEELTPEEEGALMDIAVTEAIMQQFGDLGAGYRWGDMTRTSFSFMKDFFLTGGFASLDGVTSATVRGAGRLATNALLKAGARGAADATIKAGEKIAERMAKREIADQLVRQGFKQFIKKKGIKGIGALLQERALPWTIKALGTTADDLLVRAPLMTGTIQGQSTSAKVIKEKLGKVEYDEATGTLKFADGSTWSNAIWQAGADQVIENFSEMWGAHLPGLGEAAKTFGARGLSAAILKNTHQGAGTVISKAAQFFGACRSKRLFR